MNCFRFDAGFCLLSCFPRSEAGIEVVKQTRRGLEVADAAVDGPSTTPTQLTHHAAAKQVMICSRVYLVQQRDIILQTVVHFCYDPAEITRYRLLPPYPF